MIVKDKNQFVSGRPTVYLAGVCLAASLGGLLFGFDTAVIAGTISFVEEQFGLTKLQVGWFGSSALVGCIFAAAVAGTFGDRYGRQPTLVVAALLLFVSALFSCLAWDFESLVWARIIGGAGVGLASVIAPIYIAEFAPAHIRGRLVAIYQMSIVIGILMAYFCNWAILECGPYYLEGAGGRTMKWIMLDEAWRGMFGAEMPLAILFFVMMLVMPESPRWLAKANRHDKALAILNVLNGSDRAQSELADIEKSMSLHHGAWEELLQPHLRMPLAIGIALAVFGQLTGVNIVVYYGPSILEAAGFARVGAFQFQVGLGLVNLVFTLLAFCLIDRIGRRPLLIVGMSVVTASLTVTAALFAGNADAASELQGPSYFDVAPRLGVWIVGALVVYMACNALSICAVIWVLTAEIFPTRVRGVAASIATFANWSANAIAALLFPWYVDRFGMHSGFFAFAGICLIGTVFFWKFVPETKGCSLEEIEQLWLTRRGCRTLAVHREQQS